MTPNDTQPEHLEIVAPSALERVTTMTTKIEAPPNERLELALAEALPKLGAALKNKDNPHFKSKFADLGAVIDAIRPVAEHGVWYRQVLHRQVLHEGADGVTIETLYTGFGATVSAGTLYMPAAKRDAQGFGSALTYARRYALQTAFGLATEDDDGNAAVKTGAAPIREEMPDAEWSRLVQLIEATGADTGKMLKLYGVSNLRMLDKDQYAEAIGLLNKKLADKARAETNAQAKETGDA